jgi:hypothetical protein
MEVLSQSYTWADRWQLKPKIQEHITWWSTAEATWGNADPHIGGREIHGKKNPESILLAR